MSNELGEYAVRAGPAVGTSGLAICGIGLHDWVYIATLVYTIIHIGFLAWKFWVAFKSKRDGS